MPATTQPRGTAYSPDVDRPPTKTRWRSFSRDLILIVAALTTAGTVFGLMGGHVDWPGQNHVKLQGRVTSLEAQVPPIVKALDSVRSEVRATRYIGCAVLERVNPQGAVPPQECSNSKP